MSPGINSLWRARSCITRAQGLSLAFREQHNPPYLYQHNPQRWLSTPPPKETGKVAETDADEAWSEWEDVSNKISKGKSRSSLTRDVNKRIIKTRSNFQPRDRALVRPIVQYPSKNESYRSMRKHKKSAAIQHLHDTLRELDSRDAHDWFPTFQFMMQHTEVGETLYFQIVIGKSLAAEARGVLSEPDTHISQIFRRNECVVQIEEDGSQGGELVLSLSGSEDSVRKSLRDMVWIVGKLTAVRVSDPAWEKLLWEAWKGATPKKPEIRLLGDGKVTVDDKTMTIGTWSANFSKYKDYVLTKRADEIEHPTEWTKISFEKYVAALVHGRIPNHLARSLYPSYPNHQETVVSLLNELFTSEHTKSAISLSALKMAINYIESRGAGFREVSRLIFDHLATQNFPMDAEIFNIFLVSSSKAGNLDAFRKILGSMVRKGFPPQGRAWAAFMELVKNPAAKQYIIERLRRKGFASNPSLRHPIGKQMAIIDLEKLCSTAVDIKTFIYRHTKKYGDGWMDTITFNRMLDTLGAHGQVDACNALLNLAFSEGIATPNAVSLNTILTHVRDIAQWLEILQSMLSRWPKLVPDSATYRILFRVAWVLRSPNMLRVIWRYAVFTRQTSSHLRNDVTKLLRGYNPNARSVFLKDWEDIIFGRDELAQIRAAYPNGPQAKHFITKYLEARDSVLSVDLATKLAEAVVTDRMIHQLLREGKTIDSSMRESLTVAIPLVPKSGRTSRCTPSQRSEQDSNEQDRATAGL
ncbi:uncharacterized protein F4822DRAFT_204638 [Hypoxylon trugodes]|uniref:uncharacterized protein n=1 Tax=Hypoxylon trugodes TaxID=326681 RepID=UPI0021A17C55|nr:uncharacterized protein F4822DRAFT_204638 [Hypoxylon trugodes]KAI1389553.1 hypothetical protein F4822DRAFT_204638 [Hypoxylon trugodes]